MFIKNIRIDEFRHLKNIEINLGEEKKNLILTGKNGSGKTTVLREVNSYLQKIKSKKALNECKITLTFNTLSKIRERINDKEFIIKFFETKRNSNMAKSQGVESINLSTLKESNVDIQSYFLKYMVHLKTQLAYAITDGDKKEIERITNWFIRFENLLKEIFETENIKLIYDRKNYNFKISENEKEFDFSTLSDGFSAIIEILTGIMMEMEVEKDSLHNYDMNGIVLIDEIDTHLHISLQKKIFKVLTEFFPNIQFIVTTHSPFILNSVKDVVIYDLENKTLEEEMTIYPYDSIAENYFGAKSYSLALLEEVSRYEFLIKKEDRTFEEEKEFQKLDKIFEAFDYDSSKELALKIWDLKGLK